MIDVIENACQRARGYSRNLKVDSEEDAMQDARLACMQSIPRFDETKGDVKGWYWRIARSALIRHSKRAGAGKWAKPADLVDPEARAEADPERWETLLFALAQLAPKDRFLIIQHYWLGETLTDIAISMNYTPQNGAVMHKRALKQLREALNQ